MIIHDKYTTKEELITIINLLKECGTFDPKCLRSEIINEIKQRDKRRGWSSTLCS